MFFFFFLVFFFFQAEDGIRYRLVTGVQTCALPICFTNVASYVHSRGIELDCPGLGALTLDVAYGGNFYAIIEPQENYPGLDDFPVSDILQYSPLIRRLLNQAGEYVHPEDPTIRGLSHVMWTAPPNHAEAKLGRASCRGRV